MQREARRNKYILELLEQFRNKRCVWHTRMTATRILRRLDGKLEASEFKELWLAQHHFELGETTAPTVVYDLIDKLKEKYQISTHGN